jgi:hypothetical protein
LPATPSSGSPYGTTRDGRGASSTPKPRTEIPDPILDAQRRAGFVALVVPTAFGVLAATALATESLPLALTALVGVPLLVLAGEDALAVGVLPVVLVWVPIAALVWSAAGRWAAALAFRAPGVFSWQAWAKQFALVAVLVLIVQFLAAFALGSVVGAL